MSFIKRFYNNAFHKDFACEGGVIFQICDKFKTPVRYIGIGEGIDDLQEFDPENFVNALFDVAEVK